jgi:hypothetical protein
MIVIGAARSVLHDWCCTLGACGMLLMLSSSQSN